MGYGEVGGGGSLQWQMTHNNKKTKHVPAIPGKPKQQGEAIDPDVNDGDTLFIMINHGVVIFADPAKGEVLVQVKLTSANDVRLVWGVDVPVSVQAVASAVGTLDLSKVEADRSETV